MLFLNCDDEMAGGCTAGRRVQETQPLQICRNRLGIDDDLLKQRQIDAGVRFLAHFTASANAPGNAPTCLLCNCHDRVKP